MAAPMNKFCLTVLRWSSTRSSVAGVVRLGQVRTAMYNPNYVKPMDPKDLPQDTKELSERLFRPVKAMPVASYISASHDAQIERFVAVCMSKGELSLAREVVTKAFEKIKLIQLERYHKASPEERNRIICDPNIIFHKAFENVVPVFMFMPVVRGGTLYQVPVAARPNQAELMAFKWIRDSAKNKMKNVSFWTSLARELLDAANNTGKSVKKKQDLHRQCEANKAYAHFRWS